MKQDRMSLMAGFLPALSMVALLLWEYFAPGATPLYAVLAEVLAFGLPLLLLLGMRRLSGQKTQLRLRPFRRQALPFVIWTSATVSLLSVLLNYGIALLGGGYASATGGMEGSTPMMLAAVAVAPALLEELFFRGGFLGAVEAAGTGPAILLSALCFALVHGSLTTLPAVLVAGIAYGWLAFSLDSIWAAVLAHLLNNAFSLLVSYSASVSVELGFWPYFLLAALFGFCLFLAFTMRSLERLLDKGRIRRFRAGRARAVLMGFVVSPGLWLLVLMFLVKVFYL
ncbi:MAG: CPBP family intramembrane glutamic endopeptidase [Clostridiaceae bacterium]|nr:CPBP family intramembrane glutamic endopeptidase [Clostridiaceae bacterium]